MPGNLLLCLAASHPNPVQREDLVDALYGEDANADARNRFRVSMSRLRRLVPLVETEDSVSLDASQVEVDIALIKKRLAEIELEPAVETEVAMLKELLFTLRMVLFPKATSEWEMKAQAAWSQTACRTLERLGILAEEMLDYSTAADAAEAALEHYPFDTGSWERFLRAATRLGRGAEAGRRLAAAQRRAKAESWPSADSLKSLVVEREDQDSLGPVLSPGESTALERFFRRTLLQEPSLAVEILGSTSFRPEVIRSPRAVLPLLREALSLSGGSAEARERIHVRVITALSLLEADAEVLAATKLFLSQSVAPARRRIALLNASFAHATQGDLAKAIECVEEAMSLASGPHAEYDRQECRAQRATFFLMRGDLDAAELDFRESIDFLINAHREGAEKDLLSVSGNLGLCLLMQGRIEDAINALRPVVQKARWLDARDILAIHAPVLGLALARSGQHAGPLMTQGLRLAYRLSTRRVLVAAALVGQSLNALEADPKFEVLLEAWGHRRQTATALSAIDQFLYAPVLHLQPTVNRPLVDFVRETLYITSRVGGE
ncbi:MAG: helix-turn-helix domain-containing protein [Armatimonadetes bacterium]|nr:helix-turn-helix domain-containing protein [Armatimonadota bacterium]